MATPSPTKLLSAVPPTAHRLGRSGADFLPAVRGLPEIEGVDTTPKQRIPHLHLVNRADAEVVHPTVEISSTSKVARRTFTWFGITAESVEFQDPGSVKCRFQAPIHLLIAYEQGERRGGETAIDGLPQSTLRSFARKLTFVPAGHEYRERHEPSANTRLT